MNYSIIIPVHNEVQLLDQLLRELYPFSNDHEILIVDDGSTDGSQNILKKCSFIKLIQLNKNSGKGVAIRTGLQHSSNENIVLFDGDLEISTHEISSLMVLEPDSRQVIFGFRNSNLNPLGSIMNFGNFFFNGLFNLVYRTHFRAILCGCKAFPISTLDIDKLNSTQFDIDIELSGHFSQNNEIRIREIPLQYNRRDSIGGKKLKINDGWSILYRLFHIK